MKRDASSPEHYREAVEGDQRVVLEAIRELIFEIRPEIEESIEYGMLDYPGLANLAAQKHYVSLYVLPRVLERHGDRFAGLSSGKSCLRFRRLEDIDADDLRALLSDVLDERRKA